MFNNRCVEYLDMNYQPPTDYNLTEATLRQQLLRRGYPPDIVIKEIEIAKRNNLLVDHPRYISKADGR